MITALVPEGTKPESVIRTGCCEASWTGLTRAHCTVCHATFSTPANFDLHRRYGRCTDPAERGLVSNDRGIWHQPAPE